MSALCLTNTLN